MNHYSGLQERGKGNDMTIKTKSNKGVEPIIATILLLLITVAAVSILFGVILPFMQNKIREVGGSSCMDARIVIDVKSGYTCYNKTGSSVNVAVARGANDFNLAGIQIVVAVGGSTKSFIVNESLPNRNEQSTFTVNLNTTDKATEVGIAPLMNIGNLQQNCGISSITILSPCI